MNAYLCRFVVLPELVYTKSMAHAATIGQLELVYTKSMTHLATIGQ